MALPAARPLSPSIHQAPSYSSLRAKGGEASTFALEQRVRKRYHYFLNKGLATLYPHLPLPGTVLPTQHDCYKELLHHSFPARFQGKQKHRGQVYRQAEERVEQDIPEMLHRLNHAALLQLEQLLLTGAFAQAIRVCWHELRPQLRRMSSPDAYQPRRHVSQ